MTGRLEELRERPHRRPSAWLAQRYNWVAEDGEPRKPDYKYCGKGVRSVEYMRDEFPEQKPDETMRLKCLRGQKQVVLPCFDFTGPEDDMFQFPEMARSLVPAQFLKTQREKFEEARLRTLLAGRNKHTRKKGNKGLRKLDKVLVRNKMKRSLLRRKANQQLKGYVAELRARHAEGYSVRQLMQSHIPDVGSELKVSAAEVTAALQKREVEISNRATPIILLLTLCHY